MAAHGVDQLRPLPDQQPARRQHGRPGLLLGRPHRPGVSGRVATSLTAPASSRSSLPRRTNGLTYRGGTAAPRGQTSPARGPDDASRRTLRGSRALAAAWRGTPPSPPASPCGAGRRSRRGPRHEGRTLSRANTGSMVCSQPAKRMALSIRTGQDEAASLDPVACDDHAAEQRFNQCPLLVNVRFRQTLAHALAERLGVGRHQPGRVRWHRAAARGAQAAGRVRGSPAASRR